jgi:hypothetical protein
MRKFLIPFALLAMTFGSTATVSAATGTPIHGTFDFTNTFVDTEVCAAAPWSFDVNATEHEYGFFNIWLDANGNFVKAVAHVNYDATISANGKTIVERDTWQEVYFPDGSFKAGLTVHIQGPGGIVVRDAGRIVQDADGNFVYVNGPHEQLSGVSFCPAIAP